MVEQLKPTIDCGNYDAAIFDLDGVVTDTAKTHARAWKVMFDRFLLNHAGRSGISCKPFDADREYRLYVDGKPRLEGVRSFLRSRGISLSEGMPEDPSGTETVNGLGSLKNELFLALVRDEGVAVYPATVELVQILKKEGLKTAVISSSRNCTRILEGAGLLHLFDVKLDGSDTDTLRIPGKPSPDIFLEAARRLGVNPERAIVVEDAVAGVEAGRAGGFGLVIGVDRGGNRDVLIKYGAEVVVSDLAEVSVGGGKTGQALPSALEKLDEIRLRSQGKRLALFLDYDGTLTPIVEAPEQAILDEEMRQVVAEAARYHTVAIISGRDLQDVRRLVNIDSLIYAGSHGFDIAGPGLQFERGTEYIPELEAAAQELATGLGDVAGVLVERKKFAIAVHFRRVAPERVELVEQVVDAVAARHRQLRKTCGKKIFELRPGIDWHKGKAVRALLEALNMDLRDVLPIYIGDDLTDEDAFKSIKGNGIGIVVQQEASDTAATYRVASTDEVRLFLLGLI